MYALHDPSVETNFWLIDFEDYVLMLWETLSYFLPPLLQNFKIMTFYFLILLKNVIICNNMLYFMALIKIVIVWHTIIPLAWYTMTLIGSIIVWYAIFSFTLYAMTLIGSIIVLLTSIIFPRHFYKCHWILPINIWLSLEFFISAICYRQTFPLFHISKNAKNEAQISYLKEQWRLNDKLPKTHSISF